ncbi:MAG: GNAT family N-acetyltransferase [Chloroflexi bacterium]|nr:GNAT family N-acetyltransferase [Chloroflexota bacterium]
MKSTATLIDLSTGAPVEASLFDEVTADHFTEANTRWRPLVIAAARQLLQTGAAPETIPVHWHWDWTTKAAQLEMLAITFYGILAEGELQGLMKTQTAPYEGRLPQQQGKPLVYIDYLEAAPWNVRRLMRALGKEARFRGVGTELVRAAVQHSFDEGFRGRVGLHSVSTSERFYLEGCGMTAGERDPNKENLLWCEFTSEHAERFLRGENV